MPQGKRYSKKAGKWVNKETEKAFDYDEVDSTSAALVVSFFRWYPDYFADLCRAPNASYKLEFVQRLMMRAIARFRNAYITGVRGITKTFVTMLTKMIEGTLFPGEVMRYTAPNQKQAVTLATQAFKQIEQDYPVIAQHWRVINDREDKFRIRTDYGSDFTMYAPRGDNCSQTIAEEIGQEGEDGFDMENYERNILPTCRLVRKVNQKVDTVHINIKHLYISNACTRQNKAFSQYRAETLKQMKQGEKYEGIVLDFSWISALVSNIRDKSYFSDLRGKLSPDNWLREVCAIYTGTDDSALVPDEVLSKSKTLLAMEDTHCGNPDVIYIVSHDVAYEDGAKNAKCADAVVKLTRFTDEEKKDKYYKQLVWCDSYSPPKNIYLQATRVKALYLKYCNNAAQTTYLAIDARANGKDVIDELMKPTNDGTPPLCCYEHMEYVDMEQPLALPVIYPIKAGTVGARDADGDMIRYAQGEFLQGNIELLTSNVLDGVEQYKLKHNIKDNSADVRIAHPYKKCAELCEQIQNLSTSTKGITFKEVRRSIAIQRDIWSAFKYALRVSQILETKLMKQEYRAKSSWSSVSENYEHGQRVGRNALQMPNNRASTNIRTQLLRLRKR